MNTSGTIANRGTYSRSDTNSQPLPDPASGRPWAQAVSESEQQHGERVWDDHQAFEAAGELDQRIDRPTWSVDRALARVRFRPMSPATNQNATATCSSTTHRLMIASARVRLDGSTS
jgi:hypothetical protein